MSSPHLIEYRCTCGKLLFKGLLFSSVVEVKCRRCGSFTTWAPDAKTPWTMIESDASGRVVRASGDMPQVFGRTEKDVLGEKVTGVLPVPLPIAASSSQPALLHEKAAPTKKPNAYELHATNLTLADGETRHIRSCILSRMNGGTFSGYRIFSILA